MGRRGFLRFFGSFLWLGLLLDTVMKATLSPLLPKLEGVPEETVLALLVWEMEYVENMEQFLMSISSNSWSAHVTPLNLNPVFNEKWRIQEKEKMGAWVGGWGVWVGGLGGGVGCGEFLRREKWSIGEQS